MPIHSTAIIDPQARVHESASIGCYAVIEGPVSIGAHCQIAAHAIVLGATEIGPDCRIHAHAVVGDLPQDRAYSGDESYCRVGAGTIIREGVTIHRGTAPGSATVVGERCLLMTNSHVAHNCVLEDEVILVSGALLGGHVHVGERSMVSGNAAVHQFVRIGRLAMISGLAKITQDIPPYLMTNRQGVVVGVNAVGLRRAGFTPADRAELREAYQVVYRSGLGLREAVERLTTKCTTVPAQQLLAFLKETSSRGFTKGLLPRSRDNERE